MPRNSTPGLTALQKRVGRLLARGYSQPETARRAGIAPRTIRYWLSRNPDFVAYVKGYADTLPEPSARDTLRELLQSPSEQIRLSAARALLLDAGARDEEEETRQPGTSKVTVYAPQAEPTLTDEPIPDPV